MKVSTVSFNVYDLEAETDEERDFLWALYDQMFDERRVPREHMKKYFPEGTPTPWGVDGIRFNANPASQLKRNPVCKFFSFLTEQTRLTWRKLAGDC